MPRPSLFMIVIALTIGACTRAPRERAERLRAGGSLDSSTAAAIALDRPEHMVVPLAGTGTLTLEHVSVERSRLGRASPALEVPVDPGQLSPPLPPAEPDERPAPPERAPGPGDARSLQPPIPIGAPLPSAGSPRGAGRVTLDVRVDENGEVSEALPVESNGDSVIVRAAIDAAMAVRYHPALLGGRPIAVWTRQVIDVGRARARR